MKVTLTMTSRGVVTLPIEMYSPAREAEFDAAEADLAKVLAAKPVGTKRAAKPVR